MGTDDRIWLRRYRVNARLDPEWLVLEPDGTPVAWVTYDAGFSAWEFGPDWILGIGRDSMDVQFVRRYGLVGGGG